MTPASRAAFVSGPGGSHLAVDGDLVARLEHGLVAADHPSDLTLEWSLAPIGAPEVCELTLTLRNDGDAPVSVTRMDAARIRLQTTAHDHWRTRWYRSAWGDEFRPRHGTTRHDTFLDVRSGRSSHGTAPWFGAERERGGAAVIVTPAWSGNWHITALSRGDITAGISPWRFAVELAPGESVVAPSVVLAAGVDLDEAALSLQRAVRDHWLPRSPFSDTIPTEWNHWWPYEDAEVTEEVIAANAREAVAAGLEVVTVDAGWFGASDAASDWQEQRGDWADVNAERFPSGLAHLGASIRQEGALPGIWIEAEAVGRVARLRTAHPELLAEATDGRAADPSYRRTTVSLDPSDPAFLGYVCLGSSAGRAHVGAAISDLIERMGARWIKLDFNIDPDAGCTRTDHGHGAGAGLFRHYEGLYRVLDEVRSAHPDVFFEACSSGGLRIDLGLARHVHAFFLSDPDYTEHHLQVLHGVSHLLPPLGILHWSQSQWRGDDEAQQLDWSALTEEQFATMLRAAMLHRFGVSIRLTELSPALRDVLREHVAIFRAEIAPLVRDGVLRVLAATPERGGLGERAPAFQLTSEADDRHVLAAFVLPGGEAPGVIRPRGLDLARTYEVTDLASGVTTAVTGDVLARDGAALTDPVPDSAAGTASWLLRVSPRP